MRSFETFLESDRYKYAQNNIGTHAALFFLDAAEVMHAKITDFAVAYEGVEPAVDKVTFTELRNAALTLNGLRAAVMEGDQDAITHLKRLSNKHLGSHPDDLESVAYAEIKRTHSLINPRSAL